MSKKEYIYIGVAFLALVFSLIYGFTAKRPRSVSSTIGLAQSDISSCSVFINNEIGIGTVYEGKQLNDFFPTLEKRGIGTVYEVKQLNDLFQTLENTQVKYCGPYNFISLPAGTTDYMLHFTTVDGKTITLVVCSNGDYYCKGKQYQLLDINSDLMRCLQKCAGTGA